MVYVLCLEHQTSSSSDICYFELDNLFIFSLSLDTAPDLNEELDPNIPAIILDPSHYRGSMLQGKDESDTNCWTSPSGEGFMIRGNTYLKDCSKVGSFLYIRIIARA